MRTAKNVLIVEGHPLVAEVTSLCLLGIEPTIATTLCHCTADALTAFHREKCWFRIFLDLEISGAHGVALIRELVNYGVKEKCFVITGVGDSQWKIETESMGVLSYVNKASSIKDFIVSLESAIKDDCIFINEVSNPKNTITTKITNRQQDILDLLHHGLTSKEIASKLALSAGTIDNHVTAILRALNATNRAHAISKAIELGLIRVKDTPMHISSCYESFVGLLLGAK